MAINAAALKASMKSAVLAGIQALYANIPDNQNLSGYSTADYWDKVCGAIATSVVEHIKANAQCVGADSHGDAHNLAIL